jgi:hypothetical protein
MLQYIRLRHNDHHDNDYHYFDYHYFDYHHAATLLLRPDNRVHKHVFAAARSLRAAVPDSRIAVLLSRGMLARSVVQRHRRLQLYLHGHERTLCGGGGLHGGVRQYRGNYHDGADDYHDHHRAYLRNMSIHLLRQQLHATVRRLHRLVSLRSAVRAMQRRRRRQHELRPDHDNHHDSGPDMRNL